MSERGVRPGEEIDVAAVDDWLKQHAHDLAGIPSVTQYAGGASNWTYRLQYDKLALILRRPPAGTKAASAHDMVREYRIQEKLKSVYPSVPAMIALCEEKSVLGCDFYVMEHLSGLILRANLPKGMLLPPDRARALCTNMLDELVALHQVDYRAAGLESLGKGDGFCRRQVEGWSTRYTKARTWNVPSFHGVIDWLQKHVPEDSRTCIIHNDWRFDNLVLAQDDPSRIIGVLDWELATLGDPLMELGCMLAYWVQADDNFLFHSVRRQPTHLPGMLTRREVVQYYHARAGMQVPANWVFYEVFGLFRLAGIAQQIYYRYHHKQTRNPAYRHIWTFVHALHWRCRTLMARG
jgi:aminoglycoside phosphotransferase (APT) family kinase protein